jgi:hypothetical protein
MLYAYPYAPASRDIPPPFINWNIHYETDLSIVPYALSEEALYDLESVQSQNLSFIAGVDGVMPRAWNTLRVGNDSDARTGGYSLSDGGWEEDSNY